MATQVEHGQGLAELARQLQQSPPPQISAPLLQQAWAQICSEGSTLDSSRLQVLATIVSSGLNSLSTYSALWDVESLGLCVELGSVLQRSAALLLQHAAQLPLDQHCCLQVGSAARTASAYASLTLFNTHLYAAMGQTAFLKLADGIRSMIPMFTKTAMELLKACWAAHEAQGTSELLLSCQQLVVELVQGLLHLGIESQKAVLNTDLHKDLRSAKNLNVSMRGVMDVLTKQLPVQARKTIVPVELIVDVARPSFDTLTMYLSQMLHNPETGTDLLEKVEFWWLQSYRVAAEYVDCLHTAGQSLLPQALQVALALYSLPLLPGVPPAVIASAGKRRAKIIIHLAIELNYTGVSQPHQLHDALDGLCGPSSEGLHLQARVAVVADVLLMLSSPDSGACSPLLLGAAQKLLPWCLETVCVHLFEQGMSDYSQGPPVSPESTTQGPLWHVVDTCTQFVIATARMHALAETQGGEVAPWQDPQQYGAAFTCSVRKLVQLACSPHPLEAQVSKDILCTLSSVCDRSTAIQLLRSVAKLVNATSASEALAACCSDSAPAPLPPTSTPTAWAATQLLSQLVQAVTHGDAVAQVVSSWDTDSSNVGDLAAAASAALMCKAWSGKLPGNTVQRRLANALGQVKQVLATLQDSGSIPGLGQLGAQYQSHHLAWLMLCADHLAAQLPEAQPATGGGPHHALASLAAKAILSQPPTTSQAGAPAGVMAYVGCAWRVLSQWCRHLQEPTWSQLLGLPLKAALADPATAPWAATYVGHVSTCATTQPPIEATQGLMATAQQLGNPAIMLHAIKSLAVVVQQMRLRCDAATAAGLTSRLVPPWLLSDTAPAVVRELWLAYEAQQMPDEPLALLRLSQLMMPGKLPPAAQAMGRHLAQQRGLELQAGGGQGATDVTGAVQLLQAWGSAMQMLGAGSGAAPLKQYPPGPKGMAAEARDHLEEMRRRWSLCSGLLQQLGSVDACDGPPPQWWEEVRGDLGGLGAAMLAAAGRQPR